MMGNVGGLIATWSFLPHDAPNYPIGNGLNLAAAGVCLVVGILMYFWMVRDNKHRESRKVEEELAGMSPHDIEDLDWKHPAWRWQI